MKSKIIIMSAGAAAVVAVVAAAVVGFAYSSSNDNPPPNVKFVQFDIDRREILVGESMKIFLNVESLEPRTINDTKVVILIEPSTGLTYLSVDRPLLVMPLLNGKESRTGEVQVSITAIGTPAKEAIFVVKGILYVEGHKTDAKEFDLKVRQE